MMLSQSYMYDFESSLKSYTSSSEEYPKINSVITTRSSTPEDRSRERFYQNSYGNGLEPKTMRMYQYDICCDDTSNKSSDDINISQIQFEIDVCPKKKKFTSLEEKKLFVEEYRKKYKTEMCKNWELRGSCKFGDQCSFAHGHHELQSKTALHSKYKTKPCKQYYQVGYCPYGQRCQYLHKEALRPNILYVPSDETLTSTFKCYSYEMLQEINKMCTNNEPIEEILGKFPKRPRLQIFKEITNDL